VKKKPAARRRDESGLRFASDAIALTATAVVCAGVCFAALFISPSSRDVFRIPKELAVRGEAIVAAAVLLVSAIWQLVRGRPNRDDWRVLSVCAAIIVWTFITALAALSRPLGMLSLAWVTALTAIFLLTYIASSANGLVLVDVVVAAGVVNALIGVLQESSIWQPVFDDRTMKSSGLWRHLFTTGLIGNPNDLGAFLVAPTIAAAVVSIVDRRRRAAYGIALVFLCGGLAAADSAAAYAGVIAGGLAIAALLMRGRNLVVILSLAFVASLVVGFTSGSVRSKLRAFTALVSGRMNAAAIDRTLSNRLVPFLAAARMAMDRPLTGVGAGGFGREYYRYKLQIEADYPSLRSASTNFMNFHETHCDHLQVIASMGIPGYACLLAAIILPATRSMRAKTADEESVRTRFAVIAGLPIAVAFAVVALGQFPLELAATSVTLVHIGALILSWSRYAAH
jgi:O-antigen ligase